MKNEDGLDKGWGIKVNTKSGQSWKVWIVEQEGLIDKLIMTEYKVKGDLKVFCFKSTLI